MPLEILALLVVFGVGGVVLAIHLTGGTVTAVFDAPDDAISRFQEDFPDAGVAKVVITKDRHSAIMKLKGRAAGIVHAVGDRFLTRLLEPGNPVTATAAKDATLLLRLDDISWRGGEFVFDSSEQRDAALAILAALVNGDDRDG